MCVNDVPSSTGIAFGTPRQAQALLVYVRDPQAAGHLVAEEIRLRQDAAWGQPAFE